MCFLFQTQVVVESSREMEMEMWIEMECNLVVATTATTTMIAITRVNRGLSKLTPTFIICVAKALESGGHPHNEHLLVRGLPAKMHKL